ncbi:putative CRISPR-associated Cas4 nuclease [Sulfolobales Beppu rod-shaped virus 1]|uniref:Putative CRISPR-associated Cas4 nuclease n=1 Tax=Sulfolobales Beppu rod-shaped virus 1 TaxID=2493121 RepID=A0A3S8NF75_9VIRU|nr:putative CRISPR-associated Cas4 nuclease [Sulfolobales Beppu rod-shaped virus 1]AZI75904.1 putative CRISPR-associated Cas4 nuclease [Sulfolobales Beppu rod-shaped virus 1]
MTYEDIIKKAFVRVYDKNTIFPSEIGICVRRSYFMRQGEVRLTNVTEEMDIGTVYHNDIEIKMRDDLHCETEVKVEGEIENIKISGRIDAICKTDLLEFKITGYIPFSPKIYHLQQVAIYYYLLSKQNRKIDNVYIIYIKRGTLEVKEFLITREVLNYAFENAVDFIKKFKIAIEKNDYSFIPLADASFCKNCIFKNKCYGGIDSFLK